MGTKSSNVDLNKLVEQGKVDALFKPLEKEHEKHLEEIKELKFLFKNCCYNKNKLIDEMNRSRGGFGFPDDETVKKTANFFGLKKPKSRLEMGIPVTMWADILTFEFHAFLTNIIRCCSYLARFKLKNIDKIRNTRYVSIGRYYYWGKNNKKIEVKGDLHNLIMNQCDEWIKKVNDTRNEIIHEHVILETQGYLIFSYERISNDSIKTEGNVKLGIPEYKIENVEKYVSEILEKLETFIKKFFKRFGNMEVTRERIA